MDLHGTVKSLKRKGYEVNVFRTAEEAANHIDNRVDGQLVGFGDSETMKAMHLYDRLSKHNAVYDPLQNQNPKGPELQGEGNDRFLEIANKTIFVDVFLTSVNGMAETGEMVNIDGTGNRVAGSLYGHKKIVFVTSTNKIESTLEKAIWRARNIAGPKNAKKYKLKTPCTIDGKCHDCNSPERICNGMVIYFKKMLDIDEAEVIIVEEDLGF